MANKLTEREILNSIIDGTFDADVLAEYAEKKIAQLDKRNASAKVRAEKKRAEGDALVEVIFNQITDEPKDRTQLTAELVEMGYDVTPNKVTARLSKLVNAGRIAKATVKVEGEDGKRKIVTVYATQFETAE